MDLTSTEQKKVKTSLIRIEAIQQINKDTTHIFAKGVDDARPLLKRGFVDFKDNELFLSLKKIMDENNMPVFVQELSSDTWTFTYDVEKIEKIKYRDDDNFIKAYLIGAFFSSGSFINSQNKNWIEFRCRSNKQVISLLNVLHMGGIKGQPIYKKPHKVTIRKRGYVEDFLTIIGLSNLTLDLMTKDVERNVVRESTGKENFNLGNEVRSIEAAQLQLKFIKEAMNIKGLQVNPKDKLVWEKRLKYPDLKISDLQEKIKNDGVMMSRSTLHRRLNSAKKLLQKHKGKI